MECAACGATLPDGAASCPACGATVDGDGPIDQDDQSAGADPTPVGTPVGDDQPTDAGAGQGGDPAGTGGGPETGTGQPAEGGTGGARAAGEPASGGTGDARAAGQPPAGTASGGQPGQHARHGGGEDLLTKTGRFLDSLPWTAGLVAGGLLYGLLFVLLAGPVVYWEVQRGLELATAAFVGILSFVSLSDISMTVGQMAGESVPADAASGRYDALFGIAILFVPWLLYVSGKKFAEWNDADPDDVVRGYLATGAAVVFGTVPVVAIVTFLFGGDLVNDTLMAGLLIPGLAGAFGGLVAWVFRDTSRTASWGSGIVTGIVGFVLLVGMTTMWAQSGSSLPTGGSSGMSRVVAALVVFVSVTTFGFSAGSQGLLAYAAVAVPLAGLGYFRVSRNSDRIVEPLRGARTGASLVAGFSTFAFSLLAIFVFLGTPPGTQALADAGALPGLFLPQSGSSVAQIATLGDFLEAFALAVVVFPVVVGGLGGAVAAYRARNAAGVGQQSQTPTQGVQQAKHQVKGQQQTQTRNQTNDAAGGRQQETESTDEHQTGGSAAAERGNTDQ